MVYALWLFGFRCEREEGGTLILHYYTERKGLKAIVTGQSFNIIRKTLMLLNVYKGGKVQKSESPSIYGRCLH